MIKYFSRLWNKSFKAQLVYGFGIMLTIHAASFAYLNADYQREFLRESAMKQILNRSLALAKASKVWIMANDYVGLESVLNDITIYDDLEYAVIINMDGKIIAHTDSSLFGKYVADKERIDYLKNFKEHHEGGSGENILLSDDMFIDIIRPIHEGEQHLAHVHIRLNQGVREAAINNTIVNGIVYTLLAIFLAITFAFFVANGVTNSLSKLMLSVKKFSDGKRDEHADEDGVQEISKLSHEFNELTQHLNEAEDLNQKLTERLELAFVATKDGLWDWNLVTNEVYFSPHWKEMIGYKDEELSNEFSIWENNVHSDDIERALQDIETHLLGKSDFYYNIHRAKHKNGQWLWILARGKALFNDNGKAIRMVGTHTDITKETEEREAHQHILEYQAHHDALTELPNRLLFYDRLTQGIEKARRNNNQLAIFFIDLDRFKQINDSLGHDVGDMVLQMVSDRLIQIMRKEDTLARLGGDEFTILMEDLGKSQDASILAEKILKALAEPMNIAKEVLYVSSSIGIALYPQDDIDATNLLKYADAAMYKAKDEGRNNFQFYSAEMTRLASEHISLEASLRQALIHQEFEVYYQAQINGVTNKPIGMEALVRWNKPGNGLISPAAFIPLAEETGLIIHLDQWVMRTAMLQVVQWYKDGLNPGRLALNLAMKQLQHKDFIQMIKGMLEETTCKPQWLALEVTEGHIMTNPDQAIILLREISQMGIELAVDDFGTGYSSLTYLKRLPIDKLKIDQSFIQDLPYDDEDIGITKSVIALSKSLNLEVIAEGVETQVQKDFLIENGCENIQGYFYSKPLPADEFKNILQNGFKS